MSPHLADLIFLAFFTTVLVGIAGAGILALPWKDDELDATTKAMREGWTWLDQSLARLGERAVRTQPVKRLERAPSPFDGPTAPHIA